MRSWLCPRWPCWDPLSAPDQNRVLSDLVERVDVKVNVLPPMQPKLHTRPRYELAGGIVFLMSAVALSLFMPEMSTVVHNPQPVSTE